MNISVLNMAGEEVGNVDLPESVFEAKVNRGLMHQALVRQLANARQGTHKAKGRSEVNRTTAKMYRQKGTGNARHGSRRAPIFVGGGVAHGPKPRSYVKDMPRKMRRAALRSALTVKASNGDIVVLDNLSLDRPKTKDMVAILDRLAKDASVLVLLSELNENVDKSVRNLANAKSIRTSYLNIRDLLGYDKVIMPLSSLEALNSILAIESLEFAEFDEEE
jgi:large subunit ribosomal protein L4